MLTLKEYANRDALGLKALIDTGDVSAVELCDIVQSAVQELNPSLNFLIAESPEEGSKALEIFNAKAPFSGIPFLVKEGVGMRGQPLEMGSRLGEGVLCQSDSEIVRRLKKTGVVILGSTNTPELGSAATTESVLHGPARNPWNVNHSTGGSSGGSASAVAAGVVPIAHSSDGGGSIRTPAHCCGVFGMMPTRGRNPVGPASNGGPICSLRNHVITRSVRDSAAMLDQLHGPEPGGRYDVTPPERSFLEALQEMPATLRIAFSTESPSGYSSHPDCISAVINTAKLCEDLGHQVEEATPHYSWSSFSQAFQDYWCFGIPARIQALEDATGKKASADNVEPSTLAQLAHGRQLTGERLAASWMELHTITRIIDTFFSHYDVLITPTCLTPAPILGQINAYKEGLTTSQWMDQNVSQFAPFAPIFNITGHPAMSVPLHQSSNGLPIGVQCIGHRGAEATLLCLAAQFEDANPWARRKPSVGVF